MFSFQLKPSSTIAPLRLSSKYESKRKSLTSCTVFLDLSNLEGNPNEAVKNNVFGTLNIARATDKCGVSRFVHISTDKAVNPTSVMGAAKRIREIIVQSYSRHSKTKFVVLRFGNV